LDDLQRRSWWNSVAVAFQGRKRRVGFFFFIPE
jgi:hypothetical protein